jgi:hypothetical protein
MTSLAEATSKFGDVVRDAGWAIFGVEKGPVVGSRQQEKLQIGTPDGFVKLAVHLNQPNIDAVLRERTVILVKHAEELRTSSRPTLSGSSIPGAPGGRRYCKGDPTEGPKIGSQYRRAMATDAMRPWMVQVIGLLIGVAVAAGGVGLFALSTCEHG